MLQPPLSELAHAYTQLAGKLVSDFDAIDFVHLLSERVATLTGSQAVGILLTNEMADGLTFVGGWDEGAKYSQLFGLQSHEGPCFDAVRSGRPVTDSDLDNAYDRWPSFAPRAAKAGVRSVHACPMRMHGRVIGAINVVSTEHDSLTPDVLRTVAALADLAAIGIALHRATEPRQNSFIVTELLETADELERIGSLRAADVVRDRARVRVERASRGDRLFAARAAVSPTRAASAP